MTFRCVETGLGEDQLPLLPRKLGHFAKDMVGAGDREKKIAFPGGTLCFSEDQITAHVEYDVKAGENPPMGFNVEIHQRVAANQQIKMAKWHVMNNVVTVEQDRSTQVRPE